VGVKSHHLGFVVRSIVFPFKTDLAILAGEKTIVGDGDAMGIATQIVQNLLQSSEGAFGVHSLIDIGDRFKIAGKHCRFGETRKMAEEAEWPASCAALRRSRDSRRYSREGAWTGRKKLGRQPIQRPSAVRPPLGTTKWA
jgi:hypothetical protein